MDAPQIDIESLRKAAEQGNAHAQSAHEQMRREGRGGLQ